MLCPQGGHSASIGTQPYPTFGYIKRSYNMLDNISISLYLGIGTTYCGIRLNRRRVWVFRILSNQISLEFGPSCPHQVGVFTGNTAPQHQTTSRANLLQTPGNRGADNPKRIRSRLSHKACFLRRLMQSYKARRGEYEYTPGTQYSCIHHPIGAFITG